MPAYTPQQISTIVGGTIYGTASEATTITQLCIDTRKILDPLQSLFIALKGQTRDGHDFISDAYARGIRWFLVSKEVEPPSDAGFIRVNDTLQSLQQLAAYHRSQFQIPVIGITGSNGKTILKEWLFQLLSKDYFIVRNPKSYNSQIGVPLSVWQMEAKHQLGIFEAGISTVGEMQKLARIIQPTIGIFTHIGDAHQEGFTSISEKVAEKMQLFSHAQLLIYRSDVDLIHEAAMALQSSREATQKPPLQVFHWSTQKQASLRVMEMVKRNDKLLLTLLYQQKTQQLHIPFTDEASFENMMHAICLMVAWGYEWATIQERVMRLQPVEMRLSLKQGIRGCLIINDSYNSDIHSLNIALDFLQQQSPHLRKTLILSDILQSGRNDEQLYQEVADLIHQKGIQRLIGIGPHISQYPQIFSRYPALSCQFFPDTASFIQAFRSDDFLEEAILLKGARPFAFEQISRLLEQRLHETVLEINLNALVHNLKLYQQYLRPGVQLMAVVKAFSYGSGSVEIASLLEYYGVNYLAVAYADEGIELRKAGIRLPILVMNPEPGSFQAMIQWQLEPEIFTITQLKQFVEAVNQAGKSQFPIHLKLDTGMHRLGFEPHQLQNLLDTLQAAHPSIRVATVFSHFAASENPTHDTFTQQQAHLFEEMSLQILRAFPYPIKRHLANSVAIHRHPQWQYDMVRLGIGLYGVDSDPHIQQQLQPVATLKTTVAQVKRLSPGESVGYGRAAVLEKNTTIATVRVGYADGYPRKLSHGKAWMLVHGQPAPTIGWICMDMLMLDVSHIPHVQEGDEVVVFGEDLPIQQVAQWADTIPYEIMTNISQRVKRVYYQE
ncbi:MAG: bifunctional UDP-N-acetylmuramoyl-tripeptide:D-alanyl-D-alanine ligase/alanine racemase [Thermoflavifilum sp.]|nr:bifunctional UDP-N-acetylmuramoyl-tripeptide:D-alanyl-D-alanine ligase/alanine racemase [Thermoflavifilum sp.]